MRPTMRPTMLSLLLLGACTDYEIVDKEDNPPAPEDTAVLLPDIAVSPEAVAIEGLCGEGEQELVISNVGEAPLNVLDVSVEGSGWYDLEVTLPLIIEPGESASLTVRTRGGAGGLRIQSDDPDEPELTVALRATLDQAPTLTVISPTHETIIEDLAEVLMAHVVDDVDPPEATTVVWTSNVDGVISVLNPEPDGLATTEWGSGWSGGQHSLTVTATDTCGNVATTTLGVCQQQIFEVESLDIGTWNFEGSAMWDATNEWVQLTAPVTNQSGTAFSTANIVNADFVELDFAFYMSDGSGADGFSVTALDVNRMTGFVGATGGGIGYGGLPGWSIEVDNYYNAYDPTQQDHVAFSWDGDVQRHLVWADLPDMEDRQWHQMSVRVSDPRVTVTIDGVVYIDTDVSGTFNFPAYIGFTAGTGSLTNYHLIDALMVTELLCEEG